LPIYELKPKGAGKSRMIKAKDISEALKFAEVADIKAIGGERVTELIEEGVKLEKVPDPTDPASYAPGGPLHGQTPPPGVEVPKAAETGGGTGGGKEG
jgi:hypothetical protein